MQNRGLGIIPVRSPSRDFVRDNTVVMNVADKTCHRRSHARFHFVTVLAK